MGLLSLPFNDSSAICVWGSMHPLWRWQSMHYSLGMTTQSHFIPFIRIHSPYVSLFSFGIWPTIGSSIILRLRPQCLEMAIRCILDTVRDFDPCSWFHILCLRAQHRARASVLVSHTQPYIPSCQGEKCFTKERHPKGKF